MMKFQSPSRIEEPRLLWYLSTPRHQSRISTRPYTSCNIRPEDVSWRWETVRLETKTCTRTGTCASKDSKSRQENVGRGLGHQRNRYSLNVNKSNVDLVITRACKEVEVRSLKGMCNEASDHSPVTATVNV